jgi:signal transduction histidine kinase
LEYLGIIPILSIYNGSYKSVIASNPQFVMNYLIGVPVFFLFCWYFVSEITKSLRLREHQLEDAYKKLTLINREKSQSTLRAAHELKAPLAAIKSFIYTMRDGYCGELPKQAQKVILRIGERADLLMEKVVDIIHLSNLRTLVLPEIEMTNIDLNKMLEKEIDEAQILANSRDITIEHNLKQQPSFEIFGSEKYLHTAISNILQNAINYSYEKSTINIELLHKNEQLIIVIRDHGIGIARENLTKIFDEHFRTNNAVAHNPNGTGLGLPMVKEIIKFHHAHINVDSELKKGTTFTLKFPLQNIKKAPDKQK